MELKYFDRDGTHINDYIRIRYILLYISLLFEICFQNLIYGSSWKKWDKFPSKVPFH